MDERVHRWWQTVDHVQSIRYSSSNNNVDNDDFIDSIERFRFSIPRIIDGIGSHGICLMPLCDPTLREF
jgi:hypothetical protein